MKEVDDHFGNVTEPFRPLGFRTYKANDGKIILHISGAIIRDKQDNEFSIDLDLNGRKDEVYILRYEL